MTGVRTGRGDIDAPVVINAAGTWGDRIGRTAGVEVPITVCRHKINFFTRPAGATDPHPLVYDFVKNIYTRPETGGLTLVGPLDTEEFNDRADPDWHPILDESPGDWHVLTEPSLPRNAQ